MSSTVRSGGGRPPVTGLREGDIRCPHRGCGVVTAHIRGTYMYPERTVLAGDDGHRCLAHSRSVEQRRQESLRALNDADPDVQRWAGAI